MSDTQTQTTTETTQAPPQAAQGPTGTAADPIPMKQLNQKALGIDPKSVRKLPAGSIIKLGVFFGMVQGIKYKESKFSDELNSLFVGEFRAIHPETGKVYTSEKAYFFKAMADKLEATFKSGDGKPVEFAYEIFSKSEDTAQLGYEYAAVSLIQTQASNRMDAIAAAVSDRLVQKALAAGAAKVKVEEEKPATNGSDASVATTEAKPEQQKKRR